MKAYSGSSSDGFPATLLSPASVAATATAPAPQDSSASFADVLEQQESGATTWPGASSVPPADLGSQLPLTPVGLVMKADPAPTAAVATSFTLTTPATATVPAPTSPAVIRDSVATPTLSTPVSDDAQADLPPYAWLGQPKGPVAATPVPLATTALSSSEEAVSTPAPTFTLSAPAKPAVSTFAPTASADTTASTDTAESASPLLTLAEYLLSAQPKPATPAPLATTTNTAADTESENTAGPDTATREFALPSFSGVAQPGAPSFSTLPTPATAATTAPVMQSAPDFTSAAIVASVFNHAPATPVAPTVIDPSAQAVVPNVTPTSAPAASPAARPLVSFSPLATSMAHVAILSAAKTESAPPAAATPANTTAAETTTIDNAVEAVPTLAAPRLNWVAKPSTAASGVEKKSAGTTSERSSIPPQTGSTSTTDTTTALLQAALASSVNMPAYQPVASTSVTPLKASGSLATAPIASAGTTNDKNQSDMTSTLEMQNLVVSSGTHPLVTRADADLHIQLGTNADFHQALDQVMHVADLSNLSRVTPPLRVAIEIQTPPGAIVNLYISRQPDSSYRAQLSTNDAQALGWVQQQVGSLKETADSGTAIRWSPAQLESGTTATAGAGSSGSDRDLNWNRGGQQGQSGYQQDERRRPAYVQRDEAESLGFFEAITAVGGAA